MDRRRFLGALGAAAASAIVPAFASARKIGWLGDSITAGTYLPDGQRFASIVSRRFGCEPVNLGRNGAILSEVPAGDPQLRACSLVVVSHTGTNDATKLVSPEAYGTRMREILGELRHLPLLVVTGATATDAAFHGKPPGWMRDRLAPYSRAAAAAAAQFRVPVCDAQAELQKEIDAGRPDILTRRASLRPAGWSAMEWRLYLAVRRDFRGNNLYRVLDASEDHLHAGDPDRGYFFNQHLNAHGNRVIAEAVIAAIGKMRVLDPAEG